MKHSVEEYIRRGFDEKAAKYFTEGRRTITSVAAADDFTLLLTFDNGERRIYDMKPHIKAGKVFAFLADMENFKRVYLDEGGGVAWDIDPTVDSRTVWNNQVDLCPDSCYMDSVPLK
jgi:hypothetical protein